MSTSLAFKKTFKIIPGKNTLYDKKYHLAHIVQDDNSEIGNFAINCYVFDETNFVRKGIFGEELAKSEKLEEVLGPDVFICNEDICKIKLFRLEKYQCGSFAGPSSTFLFHDSLYNKRFQFIDPYITLEGTKDGNYLCYFSDKDGKRLDEDVNGLDMSKLDIDIGNINVNDGMLRFWKLEHAISKLNVNPAQVAQELVTNKADQLGQAVLDATDRNGKNLVTQVADKVNFDPQDLVSKINVTKLTDGVVKKLTSQEVNALIRERISTYGLAKYLIERSEIDAASAKAIVESKINRGKLIEYLFDIRDMYGDTVADRTINQFFQDRVAEVTNRLKQSTRFKREIRGKKGDQGEDGAQGPKGEKAAAGP